MDNIFDGINYLIQYRSTTGGEWVTMAGFDTETAAHSYKGRLEKYPPLNFEYRVLSIR